MNKRTINELNKRLLKNFLLKTTDQSSEETLEPANFFFDDVRFQQEKSELFLNTPQPIGFSCELPTPESYLSVDISGVPIVVTRNQSGELQAFINACTHRGARVARDKGQKNKLICSFHGWSYNLDGYLVGRPQEECFTTAKEKCALTQLAVSEKHGIIVVAPTPSMAFEEVDTALDEIGDELNNYGFKNYTFIERQDFNVSANWKLVTGLSHESYHFNTLHRDSVATMLSSSAIVDTFQKHSRWAFPLKSIKNLEDQSEENWPDTLQGSCSYSLYPGILFIVNALGAQMIRAEPGANPAQSKVTYLGVCKINEQMEMAKKSYEFGGHVFSTEDLPAAEECQQGIEANKRDLLIGTNEPLLQFWHQLWKDTLKEES